MIRTEVSPFTPISLFPADPMAPAPAGAIALAQHAFEIDGDTLRHYTDGTLRAEVPPEGWSDYASTYPVVAEMLEARGVQAPAAPVVQP
jgi:hypothetical protein